MKGEVLCAMQLKLTFIHFTLYNKLIVDKVNHWSLSYLCFNILVIL